MKNSISIKFQNSQTTLKNQDSVGSLFFCNEFDLSEIISSEKFLMNHIFTLNLIILSWFFAQLKFFCHQTPRIQFDWIKYQFYVNILPSWIDSKKQQKKQPWR